MKLAVVAFVAVHGLGHLVWFFSTLTPVVLGKQGRGMLEARRAALLVDPRGLGGKVLGVITIGVIGGFLLTAWGIWSQTSWWPATLITSVLASLIVVSGMWNPIRAPGPVPLSMRALIADFGLAAATLMPWGERFLGAH